MKARHQRLTLVILLLVGVTTAAVLGAYAFERNMLFYKDPSAIAAGEYPRDRAFRVGGMVKKGSVQQTGENDGLTVQFEVTDYKETVKVSYTGILPDLFQEGQGVIARGRLGADGMFMADEVLAKHDERYMPPEVARSLKGKEPPQQTSDTQPKPYR